MSWRDGWMTAFDTETTGVDTETARIVTATIVHIHGRQVEKRTWLINPGVDIPQAAIDVHGVTNERAQAEGLTPAAALAEILAEIEETWMWGRPLIAFNAAYDLTVLDRELRRHTSHGLGTFGPIIDPFVIDKHLDKYRKGARTLTATCAHYGVRLDAAHDATEDALAAARLAWVMAGVYETELADLAEVNAKQAGWRAAWADGFRAYLRKKGEPADDVSSDWPLRAFEQVTA